MSNQIAETAKNYALVGFIFYLLAAIVGVIIVVAAALFAPMMGLPLTVGIFGFSFIISVAFVIWAWITFKDIQTGKYSVARTYSLILGILGLFFAWLIGGIFFLLAYSKLGEISTQPTIQQPQRFCVHCGRAISPEAKYCPHCGKELPP